MNESHQLMHGAGKDATHVKYLVRRNAIPSRFTKIRSTYFV